MANRRLLSFYREEKQWLEETASSDSKILSAIALTILKRGEELEDLKNEVGGEDSNETDLEEEVQKGEENKEGVEDEGISL